MSDEIKVTGTPVTYGEGATRNTKEGKGRFDLIPPEPFDVIVEEMHILMEKEFKRDSNGFVICDMGALDVYAKAMQIHITIGNTHPVEEIYYVADAIIAIVLHNILEDDVYSVPENDLMRVFEIGMLSTMKGLAKHFENGAKIYGEHNCEKGIPKWSFIDSGLRHLSQYLLSENDENHYIAAIWNLWMLLWTIQKEADVSKHYLETFRADIDALTTPKKDTNISLSVNRSIDDNDDNDDNEGDDEE